MWRRNRNHKPPVLFTWRFLISSWKSPQAASFTDHVLTHDLLHFLPVKIVLVDFSTVVCSLQEASKARYKEIHFSEQAFIKLFPFCIWEDVPLNTCSLSYNSVYKRVELCLPPPISVLAFSWGRCALSFAYSCRHSSLAFHGYTVSWDKKAFCQLSVHLWFFHSTEFLGVEFSHFQSLWQNY